MNEMVIDIKLLHDKARVPTKKNFVDAGWDLYACEDKWLYPVNEKPYDGIYTVRTGIAISIPRGYVGLIWDRSGLAAKQHIHRVAGVIDSGYHGEILVALSNLGNSPYFIAEGDRIAQLVIQEVPLHVDWNLVVELDETDRGDKGFGSSGK